MSKKYKFFTYLRTCRNCGTVHDPSMFYHSCELLDEMLSSHLCFHCAYWKNLGQTKPKELNVINGVAYHMKPTQASQTVKVGKHKYAQYRYEKYVKHILKNNLESLSVEHIAAYGVIPDKYKKLFKDENTKFISYKAYLKLQRSGIYACKQKGCWDRYHCVWYDADNEKRQFNKIPDRHQIGDEKCRKFLNKQELTIDPDKILADIFMPETMVDKWDWETNGWW